MTTKFAFRCKNCGHLHIAGHAGENELPHACSVCDHGVIHDPEAVKIATELRGPDLTQPRILELAARLVNRPPVTAKDKELVPSNWEVLADCPSERLAELGLSPEQVEKHTPFEKNTGAPAREPKSHTVNVGESAGAGTGATAARR